MREIKFKGWITELNDFADEVEVYGDGSFNLNKETDEGLVCGYDGILMQFTGLLDKNGLEIYEGDIVEWEDATYTVLFVNGEWLLKDDRESWDCPTLYNVWTKDNIKVISNYFEYKHKLSAYEKDFIEKYIKE